MAVQFQYKVALRRAMMDFDNSLLHEYAKLTEYTKLCIPYLCKRSNLSEDEAVKRLCRPSVLNEHWARDRRAWVDDYHLSQPISKPRHDPAKPKPLNYNLSQSRADPLGLKPIRICTLCANISTLLTLARLIKNYENIGIEVKCSFTSPMEYWSSPSLLEDVDIFVTEISAPIICGIDACDKYELAFPIHFTEEGVIYKNKD